MGLKDILETLIISLFQVFERKEYFHSITFQCSDAFSFSIDGYVILKFLYFTELKLPWGIFWRKKHGDDPVTSYPLNFIGEESKILTIQDIRFLFSLKHNKGFLGFFGGFFVSQIAICGFAWYNILPTSICSTLIYRAKIYLLQNSFFRAETERGLSRKHIIEGSSLAITVNVDS